jgi:hypothetical protein
MCQRNALAHARVKINPFVKFAGNAAAGCSRASLKAAAESYVAAQESGDASKMKMTLVSPLIRITAETTGNQDTHYFRNYSWHFPCIRH